MELKEIENKVNILLKDDRVAYAVIMDMIVAYGQSQYNQALEDIENRHVDYQLVGHTYITVNTKTIQELKIPTK